MSYLIWHMQKMGKADVKGIQFHNQRERESKTNPDIDKSKTHLNYDLHNDHAINYNQKVNERLSQLDTQKKIRKDAVVMNNILVTSDKGFFDNLSETKRKEFFQESYNFLAARYGKENVVSAIVHNDEKTPHMHFSMTPVTTDGRLCSKEIFDRKELTQVQTEMVEFLKYKGFDIERGQSSDREHLDTQRFKLETLKQVQQETQEEINTLKNDLQTVQEVKMTYADLSDIDQRKKVSRGILRENTVTNLEKDYERLYSTAHSSIVKDIDLKNANETIRDLKGQKEYYQNNSSRLEKENFTLQQENRKLKEEVHELKDFKERVEEKHPVLHEKIQREREEEKQQEQERKKARTLTLER